MKQGGGHSKGSNFERSIAKQISLWWSEGLDINPPRDDLCWRTFGSGGRSTVRAKSNKATAGSYGDLMATDPIIEPLFRKTTWELKKGYSHTTIIEILDRRPAKTQNCTLLKFWEQAEQAADVAGADGWGAEPLVILQRNLRLPIVIMRSSLYIEIREFHGLIQFKNAPIIVIHLNEEEELVTIRFQDFLDWATPQFFIEEWRKRNES